MNLIQNSQTDRFRADINFLNREIASKKQLLKQCKRSKSSECLPSTQRAHKRNPAHLIDFYDLAHFIIEKDPTKVDAHFRWGPRGAVKIEQEIDLGGPTS